MEKYAVVVYEEPEGGFWAEVPALPGCYSQADTLSELMDNVREATGGVLEVMREQGARPESKVQILDIAVRNRSQAPSCAGCWTLMAGPCSA